MPRPQRYQPTSRAPEATTTPVANARAAQGGPDAGTGDPDARAHDGVHAPDDRGHPDRGDDGTHSVTDPGTVDNQPLQPTLTECLGSSQSNRRCGEMTQTKFK